MNHSAPVAAVLLAMLIAPGVHAQAAAPLSLGDALERAERGAYANRIAAGEVRAQAGEGKRALQGMLPTVRVESGFQRTTDPIGAFGTKLRQRSITQQDFDPALLNDPAAISNWTGGLVLEQPILNLDAWLGRRAAAHATDARASAAEWTSTATRVDVVRAYYGAVLAAEKVTTLTAALEAARAHVRQAESMVEQGIVTRSDALLAQVRAGEVEAALIEARGDASLAKRQLATLLGSPGDTSFTLPAHLPSDTRVVTLGDITLSTGSTETSRPIARRADVRAAEAGHNAARADVRRAQSLWLPRVNGMARYDWNSPDRAYAGDENWSVGVVASWTPFAGASQLAQLQASRGREQVARAQAEAARAQAELDVAQREKEWQVALERMRIAGEAVSQSMEAHRIVARKYEGGLATVVELLGAQATETEARLRHAHARYEAIVSAAERLRSVGLDPALLADWALES